ncbi:SRPBCC domain-containing protein [Thermoactinospora rubra]|uniref:SRPBCC domain-containing protein n=1 Tax=Thermoactinospora rubra TaxID=1088767 RepID=UPI000A0F8895|nr:SRPBCC domain-containing protein [Thermoactinospora rubra]
MNPDLDLTVERVIRAPRAAVWSAWTDPSQLEKWWIPAPAVCRVDRLDVRPGGAFVTRLSEDGVEFVPHVNASFLVVDELERIVFTNAIDSSWRPANPAPVPMTAEITMSDHPDGTDYRVVVRHGDPAARARHQALGFFEGWGTVTGQLAGVAESQVAR